MRRLRNWFVASALATILGAQVPYWRSNLAGLPRVPPANTTAADISRFEQEMRAAAPYLSRQSAADLEANRALVRRMAGYLAGLRLIAHDPQMRAAVGRAEAVYNSFALYPWLGAPLYGASSAEGTTPGSSATQPALRPAARQPPFPTAAPDLAGVSPPDKAKAEELTERYETDAARAAGLWQTTENLRQSLASQGMSLNTAAATSMLRVARDLSSANESLRQHAWEDALVELKRVESESDKVSKSIGR